MVLRLSVLTLTGWVLLLASSLLMATSESVEGVWEYRTLQRAGLHEVSLAGTFAFLHGHFVQQSLNEGEPFDEQLFQAHAGTYRSVDGELELVSRVGLLIDPSVRPPIESRRNARHRLRVRRLDEQLTLVFGTGTIQRLAARPMPAPHVIVLTRGVLLLGGDGRFSLTAENDTGAVAGWGRYQRRRDELVLRPARWLSVLGGRPQYDRDNEVHARVSGRTLEVGRLLFPIERTIPDTTKPGQP